jgi:hypothetical protein
MARTPKLYQKLVRRRGGVGTYFSLWLASDHVLLVEANMMTERYQRVWLRDVQGFFVRPSAAAKWVTRISLAVLSAFVFLAVLGGSTREVFLVFAGLTVPVVLYGLFLARNCHFHVVTAVQRAEWPNVARRGQARKLLARLEPLIREAQQKEDTSGEATAVSTAP